MLAGESLTVAPYFHRGTGVLKTDEPLIASRELGLEGFDHATQERIVLIETKFDCGCSADLRCGGLGRDCRLLRRNNLTVLLHPA